VTLVVGVGNPDRGDDGAGVEVAGRVAALALARVRVVPNAAPTGLIELWDGEDDVVVVDAVRAAPGDGPGVQLLVVEAAETDLPPWTSRGGTHGFGVAAVITLARTLGRLPRRVTVVGVPGHCFDHGHGLTAPTARAVEAAVDLVRRRCGG
jgi:hydrogenase maturation protease